MSTVDRNRYRKTYGATRVIPKYEAIGEGTVIEVTSEIELLTINFSNANSGSVSCNRLYNNPVIIVTPTDNVNVFVSSITNTTVTTVTISSSASFTGSVHIGIAEAS